MTRKQKRHFKWATLVIFLAAVPLIAKYTLGVNDAVTIGQNFLETHRIVQNMLGTPVRADSELVPVNPFDWTRLDNKARIHYHLAGASFDGEAIVELERKNRLSTWEITSTDFGYRNGKKKTLPNVATGS